MASSSHKHIINQEIQWFCSSICINWARCLGLFCWGMEKMIFTIA